MDRVDQEPLSAANGCSVRSGYDWPDAETSGQAPADGPGTWTEPGTQPESAEDVAEIVNSLRCSAMPDAGTEPSTTAGMALQQTTAAVASFPAFSQDGTAVAEDTFGEGDSRSSMLMRLAGLVRIVRGSDHRFYATMPVGDHFEVHELKSPSFQHWLIRTFRRQYQILPGQESVNLLIRVLEAEAAAVPTTERVWVRVGQELGGRALGAAATAVPDAPSLAGSGPGPVYYLDLGNSSWEAVEISAAGCRIVSRPPVLFRRPRGLRPLPRPEWDGSLELLRKYVNVSGTGYQLLAGWATAALCPVGPYPILILTGEQDSGKSTTARVLRRLIDPSVSLLREPPGSARDLMVECHNNWMPAYDNISSIPAALSDRLCRISTGGGLSTRSLHSNDDETLFDVQRPMILAGIGDFVHRADAVDRCLRIHLSAISDEVRRLESAFWAEFDADRPKLLGGLLTAVSGGLRMLDQVQATALPRMADFGRWGEAVGLFLGWEPGAFLSAYSANRLAACDTALDNVPVVEPLRALVAHCRGHWVGTASQLLIDLLHATPPVLRRSADWPKTPRALSALLRRIAPQLGRSGTTVRFTRAKSLRIIKISSHRRPEWFVDPKSLPPDCSDQLRR